MRSTILAGSLLLALSGSVMAGQIYKWVDAQGVTHFGAQPPQGQAVETLNTAAPPPKTASAEPAEAQATGETEQRDIERQVKKQMVAQEAQRQQYCTSLRTNLAQLQNNPRVRVEEDGEVRRLNEEERQARIAEARQKIADTCD